jgi:hypothetical protein
MPAAMKPERRRPMNSLSGSGWEEPLSRRARERGMIRLRAMRERAMETMIQARERPVMRMSLKAIVAATICRSIAPERKISAAVILHLVPIPYGFPQAVR